MTCCLPDSDQGTPMHRWHSCASKPTSTTHAGHQCGPGDDQRAQLRGRHRAGAATDPLQPDGVDPLHGAITATPERHALAGELSTQLRTALAELPPVQAQAAVLSSVHGMTTVQLADMEQIPVGIAKSRVRAALRELHARPPGAEAFR